MPQVVIGNDLQWQADGDVFILTIMKVFHVYQKRVASLSAL